MLIVTHSFPLSSCTTKENWPDSAGMLLVNTSSPNELSFHPMRPFQYVSNSIIPLFQWNKRYRIFLVVLGTRSHVYASTLCRCWWLHHDASLFHRISIDPFLLIMLCPFHSSLCHDYFKAYCWLKKEKSKIRYNKSNRSMRRLAPCFAASLAWWMTDRKRTVLMLGAFFSIFHRLEFRLIDRSV